MSGFLNSVQHYLGRSRHAARFAAKIRNQANCVIAYHLCETDDSTKNGECALVDQLASQCKTFVDVGANVGSWSAYMLERSSAKGYLFEPSEQCVIRMRHRFSGSDLVIRHVAVSDNVGTVLFSEHDDCGQQSAIVASENGDYTVRRVPVTTLDAEFADEDVPIDFLKVDTEGYDLKVLKGAHHLLARTRFVQFEYNSHWLAAGSSLKEAFEYLNGLGFAAYLVRSTGLHPLEYQVWGDYFRYSNYFACRQADLAAVQPMIRGPY
jgi:FkbM family methyltransferase